MAKNKMKVKNLFFLIFLLLKTNLIAQTSDLIMSLGNHQVEYDSVSQIDTISIDYQTVSCVAFYNNSEIVVRKCIYSNGKISSETLFEEGEMHGLETTWYRYGSLAYQQSWKKGQLHGKHKSWYVDGKVKKEGVFSNGTGTIKEYYKGGEVKKIEMISNSYYLLSVKEFFRNGQLKYQIDFPQKDSKYIEYHDNGVIRVIGKYLDGQKDSIWTYYDKEGNFKYQREFNNGLLINR